MVDNVKKTSWCGAGAPGPGPLKLAGMAAPPGPGPLKLAGARGPAGANPGPRQTLVNLNYLGKYRMVNIC